MMSAAEVNKQFQLIQRNWRNKHDWTIKEEIRFYLEPHPLFVYDGRETFDNWNVVNCVITDRDNVASIELEMIANRYLWIDYRAGLEERARLLAHHLLTAPVLPTEINYITPGVTLSTGRTAIGASWWTLKTWKGRTYGIELFRRSGS